MLQALTFCLIMTVCKHKGKKNLNIVCSKKIKFPDLLYPDKPSSVLLTLKAPITTAADDIHKYFFHCFSEKLRLDVSSESSARQRIHLKNQALFSSKDKSEKLKCRLLQFLFGALRVKLQCEFFLQR